VCQNRQPFTCRRLEQLMNVSVHLQYKTCIYTNVYTYKEVIYVRITCSQRSFGPNVALLELVKVVLCYLIL